MFDEIDKNTKARLIKYLSDLGYQNDIYLELLNEINNNPFHLWIFCGNDYHTADDLSRWGFLQKIISPIIDRNGIYKGNNIRFAHINATLKILLEVEIEESDKPF